MCTQGFWLNFDNLGLPINVLKKKVLLYSLDRISFLQVCTWEFFRCTCKRCTRVSTKTTILCSMVQGVVFFKQGVLVGCKRLQKITKLTSGWGGGYLPPISMLNSQFLTGHIASPIY